MIRKILYISIMLLLVSCNYKNDYKKCIDGSEKRLGKIATIKTRSGHVREFIVEEDTGYFREDPECPQCAFESSLKERIAHQEDSARRAQIALTKLKELEETQDGGEQGEQQEHTDSIH